MIQNDAEPFFASPLELKPFSRNIYIQSFQTFVTINGVEQGFVHLCFSVSMHLVLLLEEQSAEHTQVRFVRMCPTCPRRDLRVSVGTLLAEFCLELEVC